MALSQARSDRAPERTTGSRTAQSQSIDWRTLSGRGTVYSCTLVEPAILPGMEAHLPHLPAVVELEGAGSARLIGNVVDVEVAAITVGMAVAAVRDEHVKGVALPRFVARVP